MPRKRLVRKHRVSASLSVVELTKAGTSLELKVFANRERIGSLEIGRGSLTWRGGKRQKEKRLSWSQFAQHMDNGRLGDQPLTVFVAGDDAAAKSDVTRLATAIGFEAVDAGPLANARLLEPLGYLNIQLGYVLGLGTQIGFKLVRQ